MNLKQAMAITPCRWAYWGFDDSGIAIKLSTMQAFELINILSTPKVFHFNEDALVSLMCGVQGFNPLEEFINSLASNRLTAIQCLSEYLADLERNMNCEVSDLSDELITYLKQQRLL